MLGELGLDRARPLVVVRTPPEVSLYHRFENPLFARRCSSASRRGRRRPWCSRAPRSSARRCAGSAVHRARARGRRPVAGRVRRPRDLGGRHDEPRGRRARHAGLHDIRGPARRRGRAAARARAGCAGSPTRRRCASSAASGTATCASGETRANSSHFCLSASHRMRAAALIRERPPRRAGRHRRLPARARLLPRVRRCASTRRSRTATSDLLGDTIVVRRRDASCSIFAAVRPLLASSGASSTRRTSRRS